MTTVTRSTTALAAPVSGRKRAAAIIVILVAIGLIVGSLAGLHALRAYQLVLNVIGAVLLGYAAMLLLTGRARGRAVAVTLSWLLAFGVLAEFGDRQAAGNNVGALSATNTTYFLPPAAWVAMIALFVVAVAVTALTKRTKGDA